MKRKPNWKVAVAITVCFALLVGCGIAANGVGIDYIVNNGDGTFTIYLTDGSSHTTDNFTGPQGPAGPGFETGEYARVDDSGTTSSTTWTDLSTPGPSVTVNITSGKALVILTAFILMQTDTLASAIMSFEISGNTTYLPNWYECLTHRSRESQEGVQASAMYVHTGLNNGSNTFTAKYMVTDGTGLFAKRNIIVIPLP